ncbi:unnamed protein product [Sphagnum balticum]
MLEMAFKGQAAAGSKPKKLLADLAHEEVSRESENERNDGNVGIQLQSLKTREDIARRSIEMRRERKEEWMEVKLKVDGIVCELSNPPSAKCLSEVRVSSFTPLMAASEQSRKVAKFERMR